MPDDDVRPNRRRFAVWPERERVGPLVQAAARSLLERLPMTEAAREYALAEHAYRRTPVISTFWVDDRKLRDRLNVAIGLHCLGIGLVDDLLDQDSGHDAADLAIGIFLVQVGTSLATALGPSDLIHAIWQKHYEPIWGSVVRELRDPPNTFERWLSTARVKSGQVLACYTEVACTAAGVPMSEAQREFPQAFGTLVMIRDDLRDRAEKNEVAGNLAHQVASGQVPIERVSVLVEQVARSAKDALSRADVDTDLGDLVEAMRQDAHRRLSTLSVQ